MVLWSVVWLVKNALGSQDLVRGHKVKKYVLTHTPTLTSKIILLNFIKLSVEFQLIEIWAFIARISIQLNAKSLSRKLPKNVEIIERMINMCYFCCLEMARSKNG